MRRGLSILSIVLGLCLGAGTLAQDRAGLAPDPGPFGQPGTVKVRVPRESVGPGIGRMVADYGSFVVFEVDARAIPGAAGVELLADENRVLLNTGALDTTQAAVKQLRKPRGAFEGRALHMVQFAGPITPEWYDGLAKTGVEVVTYIPSNTYLVYGDAAGLAAVQAMGAIEPHVQWDGEYLPEYRIDPAAAAMMADPARAASKDLMFSIQLVKDDAANKRTLAVIDAARSGPVVNEWEILNYHNLIVTIPPNMLGTIAAQPEVVSIQPYSMPVKVCERQDQIIAGNLSSGVPTGPGYLAWLASQGFTQAQFTASGFVVDVSDSGLDNGTTNPNHFGLFTGGAFASGSRVAYCRLEGTANSGSTLHGCDGHGNLNAHIVGGYDNSSGFPFADGSGYHYGLGVCPFVRVGQSVIFDPNTFTSPNYSTLQSQAYASGARISSNSWGNTTGNTYTSESQTYDTLVRDAQSGTAGNQEMVIVFAAGNSGTSPTAMHAPGNAKNVITVGAGENVQAFGGSDASGISDSGANNANDIISFSSRGPTGDGRIKPDIVAPGTHVSGGVAQAAQVATGTGSADPCFNGTGVSGGVSSIYFPSSGQQFYTASSGTSHSTPCVSGGCALLRQFFINTSLAAPSPAMTKAVLMNSARYMTGVSANDTLWSNTQGMGEMNLGEAFKYGTSTPTVFRDEVSADMFTASGQTRVFTGTVFDSTRPFRVTLAWTDAPGTSSSAPWKNNLDLTVAIGANTYKGNVFSGAFSTTGGSADTKNNVESVFLPAGTSGSYTVTVTATNIVADGVPSVGSARDQDFALVIYNGGTGCSLPTVSGNSGTQTICPGSSATFSVSATGATSYQWRKDTANITGAASSSYSIASVATSDAGSYDCVVTNACGSLPSSASSLVVPTPTSITGQPSAQSACVGGSATFTVGASGTSIGYQWRKNTVAIGGATGASLTINPVGPGDAATYDCVVMGACGSATSNAAGLTANASTTITGQPTPQTACVGGSATFTIAASGTSLSYQWNKGGSPIAGATGSTYTINPVASGDAGSYYCSVIAACGTVQSVIAGLAVNEPVTINAGGQPASQSVCAGTSGGLTLSVDALGTISGYQWRKGGVNIAGATGPQYVINPVGTADTGSYDCVVTGVCNTVTSSAATVTVTAATAVTAGGQPQPQTTCVGGSATFGVTATGGGLTYQWRKGGVNVAGATSANYTINPVAAVDAASYDCVVTGTCGIATSAAAALTLTTATAISGQPGPQTTCVGGNAMFGVTAAGDALTYQWRKGGVAVAGATGATLSINPVASGDAGTYDCVVTGTCGAVTSATATLALITQTAVTGPLTPQSVCAGGSASFAVTASGSGLHYQWRKSATPIAGATSASLTINPVAAGDAGTYDCVVTGDCGQATSDAASLAVNDPLLITGQPTDQSVCEGAAVTLGVAVTGTSPTYQWRKGGVDIGGATGASLTINPATTADAGAYDCVVTATCGTMTSGTANVGVCTTPSISGQPSPVLICPGGSATFVVSATGSGLAYQWRRDGNAIPGAANSSIVINPVTQADGGNYDCVVGTCCTSATSNAARLNVCAADFNCSGTLAVQDIFDFLTAWFNGSPSADFNGGGLAVQDIFDFLTAWFAGCP